MYWRAIVRSGFARPISFECRTFGEKSKFFSDAHERAAGRTEGSPNALGRIEATSASARPPNNRTALLGLMGAMIAPTRDFDHHLVQISSSA